MGRYIQTGKRTAAPIFPKMPNAQQGTSREVPTSEKMERTAEKTNTREKPITEMPKASAPTAEIEKKKFTASELRNGFKMSVIIGEPVSRKYQKHR